MKKVGFCILVVFCCLVMTLGCKKDKGEEAPSSAGTQDFSSSPFADSGDDDSMMASVNGIVITRAQLDQQMDRMMMQMQGMGMTSPEQMASMRPMVKQRALDSLISQTLLVEEADRQGIKADEKEVEDQIAGFSSRFPSQEEFQKQLAAVGTSEEELREEINTGIKINTLLERQLGEKDVTEEEIKAFYVENPDNFKQEEQVQASHILLKVAPGESDEDKESKKKKLTDLKASIQKGADFAELARQHSECPSKERGGDLGFFGKGQMVKPFEDIAFALKKGEVSDPVETQFGYHLIKLTDRKAAGTIPLEDAKEDIKTYLRRQKEQQAIKDYIDELRKGADIKYAQGMEPQPPDIKSSD